MSTTAHQIRVYAGPALLSYGFRIFFLGGAVWAATAMALWPALVSGELTLPSTLTPLQWHVHEMLFGFLPAVVAGFLLTAVPNWTGRLPVSGAPLLNLFLIWMVGRAAIFFSQLTGAWLAAAVDLAFLATLLAVMAREIVAGRSLKNLRVLVLVGLLLTGDAVFLGEAIAEGGGGYGMRLGLAAAVLLISLIGGRIIPSFTRNWLVKQGPGGLPVPFGRFDIGVIGASAAALAAWVAVPEPAATGALLLLAGVLQTVRLARWAGWRTTGEPLLAILHVGYAFVPLGFVLVGASVLAPQLVDARGALHAWTAGAIGVMTLAVMTRATLGHTGRALHADAATVAIYVLALVAVAARLAAAFGFAYMPMLYLAASAWVLAFGGYAVVYGPLLAGGRRQSKAA